MKILTGGPEISLEVMVVMKAFHNIYKKADIGGGIKNYDLITAAFLPCLVPSGADGDSTCS